MVASKALRAALLTFCSSLLICNPASALDPRPDVNPKDGTEPILYKIRFPKIINLAFTQNPHPGVMDLDPSSPIPCERIFELSERDVRRFFANTNEVTDIAYSEVLPLSPCRSSGTLVFANGRKADWEIRSFRTGTIEFKDSGKIFYLYCPHCGWKPFQ